MKKAIILLFVLALLVAPAAFAQSLSIVSGNGQVVQEQRLSNPLVVQVKDAAGNPVAGVAVTWNIAPGTGTLVGQTNTTDASGKASASFLGTGIQPGYSFLPGTVTASSSGGSVTFQITTGVGQGLALPPLAELRKPALETRTITGASGSVLPGAVSVQVTAQSGGQAGQAVPNVSMQIVNGVDTTQPSPATCNVPGGAVLTNANGSATCDLLLSGTPGTYVISAWVGEYVYTPTITLTITEAQACTYAVTLSATSFNASANSGTINVSTGNGCGWRATSPDNWITIASGGSG